MNLPRILTLLCFTTIFLHSIEGNATVILVENTYDSGSGSFRSAVASASLTENDTILVNVKGTIILDNPINFNGFSALTVIGPYPAHNSFSPSAGCSGSLFNITSSEQIHFKGLGFVGQNGLTRHVAISNCPNVITFESCLFKDNITSGLDGSAACLDNSRVDFTNCSFINNEAQDGGAVSIKNSSTSTILNCTFSGNNAINRAGAIQIDSGSEVNLFYNTFVGNTATYLPQAIRLLGISTLNMENNAIGDNGSDQQIKKVSGAATLNSFGGNRIKLNYLTEPTDIPLLVTGDYISYLLFIMGLRSEIKTDGFGLMYYPIVDESSSLINPSAPTSNTPEKDCRNAPRSLKGSGTLVYPDAGAAEYTHLQVTNGSGDKSNVNSFLWTLESAQLKDTVHYVEFDIPTPTTDILFESIGTVSGATYIIDGFSQPGSVIPGPHLVASPALTRAVLPIDFVDGTGNDQGIRFVSGATNSALQGVSVQGFNQYGVETNVSNTSFFGCEIGINNAGSENGNLRIGLKVYGANTQVGGWEHWMRNVISGNGLGATDQCNILLTNGNSNAIQGNIIGAAGDGISTIGAAGTTKYGLHCETSYNLVGGTTVNMKNIIVDNEYGVFCNAGTLFNTIQGNNIGLGWDNLTAIGNTEAGIFLSGASDVLIGGYRPEATNRIAYNETGIGLVFDASPVLNNRILGNLIYNNVNQGIDLEADYAVVPNDGLINATEANFGLDYPVLTYSENCSGLETITTYELSVTTGDDYRVEFFSVSSPDPTNGEGEFFLGSTTVTVTTNPQTFTYNHGVLITPGTTISATVTQISSRSTSEFGTNIEVVGTVGDPSFSYANICYGDTARVTYLGDTGGSFRFSDPAPVDVTIDPATGDIIGGAEGATYEVIYDLGGVCDNEDTTTFSVISVDEGFVFDDFCPGTNGTPSTVNTPGGEFFLYPDLGDGATITTDGGILSGGIENTTYTVMYITEGMMGCKDTGFVDVLVTPTDESFTMTDFCAGVTSSPASPVTPGGVFSFDPVPLDGASINPANGAITGGLEGSSYTVKYVVGPCDEEFTLTVNTNVTDESFTFDPFCPDTDGSPSEVVVPGGFSFLDDPGDGAAINAATGVITGGQEGTTYSVLHTVGVCFDKDTAYPQVIIVPEVFTFADFCIDGDSSAVGPVIDLAADPDSVFFSLIGAIDGATINPATGIIYNPVEGNTYTVKDSVKNEGCSQTHTLTVSPLNIDESFTMADFCAGVTSSPASPATPGGVFSFDPVPLDGASINPANGAITGGVEGSSYTVKYVVGACDEEFTLTVNTSVTDESFSFNDFCAESIGLPVDMAELGGEFSFAPDPGDGALIDPASGALSSATPESTYPVQYVVGECMERDTLYVYAKASDIAAFNLEDHCANIDLVAAVTGTPGGIFSFDPPATDGAIIDSETGLITYSNGGSYGVRYITPDMASTCPDTLTKTITLFASPVITDLSSELDIYCPYNALLPMTSIASEAEKIYWYKNSMDGEILDSLFSYTPTELDLGNNLYYALPKSAEGCFGEAQTYTLFLSDTSGMQAISDFEICLGSPAILGAVGGISYTWTTDVPLANNQISNPIAFSLEVENYHVTILNNENCEVIDTLTVGFLSATECSIEVYNAFSPNDDGTNDFWYIDNLINFVPNTVYIYNRWGDEINAIKDYDNITTYWDGNDKNGNALPPSTYFYVVITEDSEQSKAGWVQLVR